MVAVSENWKAIHQQRLLPETFIELSYSVTKPGLQQMAVPSANLEETYSDADSLASTLTVDREKYNSLEWNFWGLDGSFGYFDGQPENPGYRQSIRGAIGGERPSSDSNCAFIRQ